MEIRIFGIENLEDACAVVRKVFSEKACGLLSMGLKYPKQKLLAEAGAGVVAYEDGAPVGFHAAFPRLMVNRSKTFTYISGSSLGVLTTSKTPLLALRILKKTQLLPRAGSLFFVGNTINRNRMRLNEMLQSNYKGPQQCAEKRIMVVRTFGLLLYLLRTRIFKQSYDVIKCTTNRRAPPFMVKIAEFEVRSLQSIDVNIFCEFWESYKVDNKGITASRSPEEIEWMFGERVADGRALILGLFSGERMEGYVIVSTDNGVLWSVKDIIVLGNNLNRLDKLLIGLKRFMLKCTPAVQCQITGYPTAVQATLSRHFPIKRALDNNQYFIHFQGEAKKLIDVNTLDSIRNWLFGAYEGDAAML